MVVAQGGDKEVILNPELLPTVNIKSHLLPIRAVLLKRWTLNRSVLPNAFRAGRRTLDDEIDMAVGLEFVNKVGAYVNKDDVICYLHANSKNVEQSLKILQEAIKIGKNKRVLKLIEGVIK